MKQGSNGAGPTRAQLKRARILRESLVQSGGVLDEWVKAIGYTNLVRTDVLPDYTRGALRNGRAYVRDGLGWHDQAFVIAHEDTHKHFHVDVIAHTELDLFQLEKDETQANLVAMIVLWPDLTEFETEDEFIRTCPLGEAMAKLRVRYHYQNPKPLAEPKSRQPVIRL